MISKTSTCSLDNLFSSKKIRFIIAGAFNTLFGYSVYAVLVYFNFPYAIALLVSTISGVIFNYYSLGKMVFDNNGGWFVFRKFLASYIFIYIANAILLSLLTRNLISNPYLAQAAYTPVGVCLSWLLMNNWVYKND